MLELPVEVLCGGILPCLSVCDLQALDTAFTNKYYRPQLQEVWKSYQYDSINVKLEGCQIAWLCGIGVQVISLVVDDFISDSIITNIPTLKKLQILSECFSTLLLKLTATSRNLEQLCCYDFLGPNVDNAVSALAQNCRQLHTLHISSYNLTDIAIMALAECCTKLHTVRINGSGVTDAGVQALCDNCPHLKHIGLSNCSLTDASLMSIANSYPHLERIHSIGNNNFTDDGLIYFADKCHELRSVSVRYKNATNRGLTALWAANPNLMDVDISFNPFIDEDIIQLVQCCPLLQKLNISHCSDITDAAVIAVAEHCPQLRSLNISYCFEVSDASLIALGQHCHELISINISFLKNISDVGIAALAAGCPLLQEFYASDTNITDAGVIALARGCRNLRKIILINSKGINFASVFAITENCPLILELHLSYCPQVDDACLCAIAEHCHNLGFLYIQGLIKISTASVIHVISSCCMLDTVVCYGSFTREEDRRAITQCSRRLKVIKV